MPIEVLGTKMFNLKEAASELGISYATVKSYYKAGKISGRKIGRSVLIPEGELRRFAGLEKAS